MSRCEDCQELKSAYQSAVTGLRIANEQFRRAKAGSVVAAVARRKVHASLTKLIAVEALKKAHQARHMGNFHPVRVSGGTSPAHVG
jgi:hypothetical protein